MNVDLFGALDIFEPISIFQVINMVAATGELEIQTEGNSAQVFFKDGNVVYGSIESRPVRLGEYLIEQGYISPHELKAAIQVQEGRLSAREPQKLFSGRYVGTSPNRSYDVTLDGRFLLIKRPDEESVRALSMSFFPDRIHLIQNWFAELEEQVAASQ